MKLRSSFPLASIFICRRFEHPLPTNSADSNGPHSPHGAASLFTFSICESRLSRPSEHTALHYCCHLRSSSPHMLGSSCVISMAHHMTVQHHFHVSHDTPGMSQRTKRTLLALFQTLQSIQLSTQNLSCYYPLLIPLSKI